MYTGQMGNNLRFLLLNHSNLMVKTVTQRSSKAMYRGYLSRKNIRNRHKKSIDEPPHDKTSKMTVRPAKSLPSLIRVFAVHSMGS